MNNEQLQKWSAIAEITAAVAVVISLIVVAYELHQSTAQARLNTSAVEIATYQDLTTSIAELNSQAIQDEQLASIFLAASSDNPELTELEQVRFALYLINVFRHGDMAYFQYEQGAIDEARLNSTLAIVAANLGRGPIAIN